jgi:RanBP-type and C3HC4-type zinc finger-containing protein 1
LLFYCCCIYRKCLQDYINNADNVTSIQCPFATPSETCTNTIKLNDISSILDVKSYKKFELKRKRQIELSTKNRFHCLTPDCAGFCIIEEKNNNHDSLNSLELKGIVKLSSECSTFHCDECDKVNCMRCNSLYDNHKAHVCHEAAIKDPNQVRLSYNLKCCLYFICILTN